MKSQVKKIHFVGIGGIGMSGLAEAMSLQGFEVSGSDKSRSEITDRLESIGIKFFEGHDGKNFTADMLVYSSAVDVSNAELLEAQKLGALCVKRAELLGEMMRGKKGITVAGTHGKTTTSAMIGMMLEQAGLDPTMFIGGIVNQLGTNTRLGNGDYLVAEADEYDRSFWTLFSHIAVVNNIESDHLDIYVDETDIQDAFVQFSNQTSLFGTVIINADDPGTLSIRKKINRNVKTFGISPQADIRGSITSQKFCDIQFDVFRRHEKLTTMSISLNGKHNVSNALACIAVGLELEIPIEKIAMALKTFRGTGRRFEVLGQYKGATMVDDYAHHPTEIVATLTGARDGVGHARRIIAVFQPHLYSRTRDYLGDFANAFGAANEVILTDIYAAREKPLDGVSGQKLFEATKKNHSHVMYEADKRNLGKKITEIIHDGDLVITMGAGDITQVGRELVRS